MRSERGCGFYVDFQKRAIVRRQQSSIEEEKMRVEKKQKQTTDANTLWQELLIEIMAAYNLRNLVKKKKKEQISA